MITVGSPGFFDGGTPRQLKGYDAPLSAVLRGTAGQSDANEGLMFKKFQSIRKRIMFSKISTFFCNKSPFSEEKYGELSSLYKYFTNFSQKYYKNFNFSICME